MLDAVLLACVLINVSPVISEVPSWDDRTELMDFHMKIREDVKPTAKNMRALKLAADWISKCTTELPDPSKHPAYYQTISTLAVSNALVKPSMIEMARSWEVEKKNYVYATNNCTGVCVNYKKLIWAHSTQYGCAMSQCIFNAPQNEKPFYILICVYKTGRALDEGKPYEEGPVCTACPPKFYCHRNQCLENASSK